MSLSTEHLSLPPLVKGSLNGHLTIKVDDLIWCRQPPGDVYVEFRWWGMSNPVVFRPSDVTHRDAKSQWSSSSLLIKDYTVTFDVRTSLTMLENYLKNCENLEFIVVKSKCYEKIGTVTVTDLKNLVKERMYQRYFPIINSFGNRIGDLHIGFSLWMKSKTDEGKENKLSANDLFVNPIRKEKKNKGKSLKICKRHSSMLKNGQNNVASQLHSKNYSMDESKKEKPPDAIESCKLILKDKIDSLAHPNSNKSNMDLDSILSRGEKLRNAMFSSLYEDGVLRKIIPLEPTDVSCSHGSFPFHPSSSVATHGNNKAVLIEYLTGADISSGEKQVAMETLKSVSPAESILFDSLSVEEVQPRLEKVEEKLQEECAVEANDADKQASSTRESCKLDCMDNEVIVSARSSCEESQSKSQDTSKENHNGQSEELRLLQAAFATVNCCRITVDYLKLVSSNVCKNESKESFMTVRSNGGNKKQCQQPGAVYFVEYNFNDIKQPLNQQYHIPVRYSTKKQSGPVVHFGQKHVHNVRKPFSVERLKVSLQNANWKILRRYLNQRVPSLIGNVFIEDNLDVRLESNLKFPVKSSTGMLVGELFIQLELGKDRGIFGNYLLGEKILAFPGKSMNQACVEIQTESSDLAEPSVSRDSLNNWTSSTTGNSRINVGDHLPKQSAGKCHQIIIELDELTNHSALLKSGKDEACYIDYKFPELDEKTSKIHFSNKFFTTDCVNCSPEMRFFFRHSHLLNASSLSQALLSAAIPGITFSLWTRKFHPGIHDHLVATSFLPTAKLCSMENELDNRNLVLQETLTLPLTSTSAIQHKGELHSKSRCSLTLTLTYRQMTILPTHGQKTNSINSSVGPTSSNTEVTAASDSTNRHFNELENYVERDNCILLERAAANESHFPSSEKIISQLKQIESHKYCVKDSCVCRNYHSLFSGEKTRSSKYPVIDDQCTSLINKRSMKNNDDSRKIDVEKRLALDTVNNPAISSILNSQLSEECQKKFVNFILHGNTKLSVASRCDSLMNNSNGNSDLKSKIKSILSQCSLENMNKALTTVQHVHVLQSGNLNEADGMCQFSTEQDMNDAGIIPNTNHSPPEQNQQLETVEELVKEVECISAQSLNAKPDSENSNTTAEFNDVLDNCSRNEHDKYSLDLFKVISPPAGFENSPSSSIQTRERNSDIQERLYAFPVQSLFEENGLIPSASGISSFQQTGFVSQENVLRDEQFSFKPLYSDKRVMSSASDIFDKEKRPGSSIYDGRLESSRKQRGNTISESYENINVSRSSRATQELQEQRSDPQLCNYVLESRAACTAESLYELEMQSGSEDGEDLLSVVTRSVENVQLDSNRSEDNHQEHDIDDLLIESQQRKSADSHSMESTWIDSVKVSSELRNVLKHLNPNNKNDDEAYDKLLCELKAYVDNVAVEIKSQLDLIESNLHERQQNTGSPKSDLLATEIEGCKEREDISSANAYSIDSQNDVYAYNTECASSVSKNSNHSVSSRIKETESNTAAALPIASPRSSIDCLAIHRNTLPTDKCSASSAVFSSSTSSAFTKYKSTKHHKKQKLFKAKVEVERGYHLPKVTHPFSQSGFADDPNTFVKLQTSCHSLDEGLFSNVVENSCDPVWMACFDVDLPTELLKQGVSNRLIVQVFEKRERVTQLLGSATIGLGVLSSGLSFISGWFNLFDVSGICKGQIRVNITPIDNIANLRLDSPDTSEKETCGIKNMDHNIEKTYQKQSGNSIFSNLEISEVDGDEKLPGRNKIENPSVQLTSSLKSKLSELDLLIDALKIKLRKSGRSHPIKEAVERLQLSKSSSSIEELERNDSLENVDKMQYCGFPKILTGSSCSNEVRDFYDNRKVGLGDVSRKRTDQEEDQFDDNRREDDSQFRTYSIHSDDDDSSAKTDAPDNSDQE